MRDSGANSGARKTETASRTSPSSPSHGSELFKRTPFQTSTRGKSSRHAGQRPVNAAHRRRHSAQQRVVVVALPQHGNMINLTEVESSRHTQQESSSTRVDRRSIRGWSPSCIGIAERGRPSDRPRALACPIWHSLHLALSPRPLARSVPRHSPALVFSFTRSLAHASSREEELRHSPRSPVVAHTIGSPRRCARSLRKGLL